MNWVFWLAVTVVLTAVVAVSGKQPRGTRSVGHTRLMHVARLVLVVMAVFVAYAVFRARRGN